MIKKFSVVFLLLFTYLFLAPHVLGTDTEACDDNSPVGKPILVSAVAAKNSVTITWTKAQDPITHYLLAYSRNETDIEYGNTNIGDKDTTTYTVGGLTDGVKYYFKVRPVNGCRPGDFSNKLSAIPGTTSTNSNNTKKYATVPPNISIYKTNVSTTATPKATIVPTPIPTINNNLKCSTCQGWEILALNAVLLALYFQLARGNKSFKQIFSVLIPIGMYILFLLANQGCTFKNFTCKYFVPLEIITFITVLTAYKMRHISFKDSQKSKN